MDTLKQFALANWRKMVAWLVAGGTLWILDQIKEGLANGTIVVPAEWQGYTPVALFVITTAIALATPSHHDLSTTSTTTNGPSQPDGTR